MSSKNVLWWVVLAAWILAWCSNNNNNLKEGNGNLKDSITVIKDSVNNSLIDVVDKDNNQIQWRWAIRYKKMPLLDDNTTKLEDKLEDNVKFEKKDTVYQNYEKIVRMYEAWIDDWDEMKEYLENHNYPNHDIWTFIVPDTEWEDNHEIKDYDSDEDKIFIKK